MEYQISVTMLELRYHQIIAGLPSFKKISSQLSETYESKKISKDLESVLNQIALNNKLIILSKDAIISLANYHYIDKKVNNY